MHNFSTTIDANLANRTSVATSSGIVRRTLIGLALLVVALLVLAPVALIFYEALGRGLGVYWDNLVNDSDTLHSIRLTLIVAPIAVAMNTVFGIAAAWLMTRFRFTGRTLLTSLIDIPFSVSPIVAGLMLVLLFGLQGYFGPWLREHDIKVIFALPGIVMATMFVTMPFVARELIPVMEATGKEEELAAISLGAKRWQLFWKITLPNIKWGLLYGMILCNARAIGEFGAVYVVSGRISGQTTTMPLRIEKLFQDPTKGEDAFALASLLTLLALFSLAAKTWLEVRTRKQLREAAQREAADAFHASN